MKRLTKKRKLLAEAYLPLAKSLARQFAKYCPQSYEDDIYSLSFYALVLAARSWDGRRVAFPVFAKDRILGRLRHETRAIHRKLERRASPSQHPLEETLPDCSPGLRVQESRRHVQELIRKLPNDRHREILTIVYVQDRTPTEAAAVLQMTEHASRQLHTRAIRTLRRKLERA